MAACWSHLVLIAIAAIIGISLSASIEKQNNFDTYAPQKDSYLPPKDMLFAMDPIDQCLFACTTCFKEVSFTMLRPTCICCSQFPMATKSHYLFVDRGYFIRGLHKKEIVRLHYTAPEIACGGHNTYERM